LLGFGLRREAGERERGGRGEEGVLIPLALSEEVIDPAAAAVARMLGADAPSTGEGKVSRIAADAVLLWFPSLRLMFKDHYWYCYYYRASDRCDY
jgi:hypothetical protein